MGAIPGFFDSFGAACFCVTNCIYWIIFDFFVIFIASLLCVQSMTKSLKILALSALRLHIVAVR
jgi:hypothetical protein